VAGLLAITILLLHMEQRNGEGSLPSKLLLLALNRVHGGAVIVDRHGTRVDGATVNSGTDVRVDEIHHERVHHGIVML